MDVFAGSATTAAVAHKLGRRWVTCDISSTNVTEYAGPRLCKVVSGEDTGGISSTTRRVAVEVLPQGVTPDQAQAFLTAWSAFAEEGFSVGPAALVKHLDRAAVESHGIAGLSAEERKTLLCLVRKAAGSDGTVDLTALVSTTVRRRARTRTATTQRWAGGGGFRTVAVASSMYEVTPFGVMLAEWATNGRFARAVAAQLGFRWQADAAPFCGVRGRMRLAVLDGAFGSQEACLIASALGEDERVTVVAKAVLDGAEQTLAQSAAGSRVRKAPRDLLTDGARRVRRRSEGELA